jgi:hypothetical protein
MQLFAIIARVDEIDDIEGVDPITGSRSRKVVKLFLGGDYLPRWFYTVVVYLPRVINGLFDNNSISVQHICQKRNKD